MVRKDGKSLSHQPNLIDNEYATLKPSSAAIEKAEKIRLAIEKIKEASIKKIFIKVFLVTTSLDLFIMHQIKYLDEHIITHHNTYSFSFYKKRYSARMVLLSHYLLMNV